MKENKLFNVFGARKSKRFDETGIVNISIVRDIEGGREFATICRKVSDDTQIVKIGGKEYVKLLIPFLMEKKPETKQKANDECPF